MNNHFTKGLLQGLGFACMIATIFGIAYAADIFTVDDAGTKKFVVTDEGKITIGATESYVNLVIQNDGVAPNNKVGMTADVITVEGIRIESLNVSADITVAGAGGLDTGAEAGNTWYYLWVLTNNDGSSINGLLSTSSTAPTVPGGFTKKRRIGSVRNDASSNFLAFTQVGNLVSYWAGRAYSVLTAGRATSSTDVDCSTYIPTTSQLGVFDVVSNITNYGAGVGNTIRVHPKGASSSIGQISIVSICQVTNVRFQHEKTGNVITDSSQVIQYKCDFDPNNGCYIYVVGYYDRI